MVAQYPKAVLHLVQPGGVRKSIIVLDVGMLDPPSDHLAFVGTKVVQNDTEFVLRIVSNKW